MPQISLPTWGDGRCLAVQRRCNRDENGPTTRYGYEYCLGGANPSRPLDGGCGRLEKLLGGAWDKTYAAGNGIY
jgi:hypothetical protein